jgi:uncharacterized protein DUF3606
MSLPSGTGARCTVEDLKDKGDAMPDDLSKRGPQDRTQINVNEPWEFDYWSKELGVTPEELRKAVKEVGVMVADVRRYLGK